MKGHRKAPEYPCKHCHIGFGSRQSKWNHEQRCLSNPGIEKQLKILKKANQKYLRERLDEFVNEKDEKIKKITEEIKEEEEREGP